jgi:hypothetical protein
LKEPKKIKDYTHGMIGYYKTFNTETLIKNGFNPELPVTLYPNKNTETEIQLFLLNDIKAVKITSEVETKSEGTLIYQSFYIFEKDKPFFDCLK